MHLFWSKLAPIYSPPTVKIFIEKNDIIQNNLSFLATYVHK